MTIILREDTPSSCIGVKNFGEAKTAKQREVKKCLRRTSFQSNESGHLWRKASRSLTIALAESTKFRSSPHLGITPPTTTAIIPIRHIKNPGNISMPRSTATSLAFTALLLSDLTLPSRGFAPSGVTFIANKNKRSFRSSLSMVFGFGQTRSGGEGGGGGKRKRPDQPHASSFSARSSVVRNSADSESTRAKIDTSNFGVSNANVDTVRDTFRDDVYQNSLHRLLCDGEEECLF